MHDKNASQNDLIINHQLDFYRQGLAGCQFAVRAAHEPERHQWTHKVIFTEKMFEIDQWLDELMHQQKHELVSLLFPLVSTKEALQELFIFLSTSSLFFFEPPTQYMGHTCIALRVNVGGKTSWVSGLGPFDFLPKTRRAPCTELVFRPKDKPPYVKNIQPESPADQLHVANLTMPNIEQSEFVLLWRQSFMHVKTILGSHPNLLSAAKTTLAIPLA